MYFQFGGDIERSLKLNSQITAKEVRLVDKEGNQKGILPLSEALELAQENGYSLVEIGPNSDPPVCKIMDYEKYRFEQKKKMKELKKKQITSQIRELTMGPAIESHDYEVKLRKAQQFLSEGNKVKLTVRFKGRQIIHKVKGEELLTQFTKSLEDLGIVEKPMALDGRKLMIILRSKKGKKGQEIL